MSPHLALVLIALHTLDGQLVYVNPAEIVSVRTPTTALLHQNVRCMIQTADGKWINVADPCEEVVKQLRE